RADVVTELKQARANGELLVSEQYPVEKPFHSTMTRAQVQQELQQARQDGTAVSNTQAPSL
ncbi:DUF4148 domain-containing protein, partial [Acinetobacter baumannii]